LLNVTSRRKPNTKVIESHFFINATFYHWSLIKKASPHYCTYFLNFWNTSSWQKKLVQEQLRSLVPESPQDPNEWKDAMLCQEITNPNGLSARESEAILVIKQLQDQVLVFFLYLSYSEMYFQ
jgi:hypothetical protein